MTRPGPGPGAKPGAPPSPPSTKPPTKPAKPATPSKPAATTPPPTPAADISTPASSIDATISACDLLMGDSGSGKTSLLATLARYVWEKHKLVTLLFSADPGGWVTEVQTLINLGIIRGWKITTRDPEDRFGLAFETCLRASQGYWPKKFTNLSKGHVPVGVELVPPVTYEYKMFCPNGHVVRRASFEKQLEGQFTCIPDGDMKKCGVMVSLRGGAKVTRTVRRTKGFEQVGAVVFDGLTSMCAWAMRDLQNRGARVPDDERDQLKSSMKIESGDITLGGSTMPHYGAAQQLAERMVNAAGAIPHLVARPVWTALEKRGTDDKAQIVIYGPDIPGSAKTATVPQWVGNLLGCAMLPLANGEAEWRLYLRRYTLPNDPVPHLAKTRVAPGYLPEFLTDGPVNEMGRPVSGVDPFTTFNLGHFYGLEENALAQQQRERASQYKDAPGLVELELGEDKIEEGSGVFTVPTTSGGPGAPAQGPGAAPGARPRAPGPAPTAPAPAAPPAKPAPAAPAPSTQATTAPPPSPQAQQGPTPPAGPRPPAAAAAKPK